MKNKPLFKERVCKLCGKVFKPNGASQVYCTECSEIRTKERKKIWYKEHHQYSPKPKILCCVCGGKLLSHYNGKPYCSKHYNRVRRNGTIEKKQGNTYEFCDDIVKIITSQGRIILVDKSDFDRLKTHSWCISKTGYAVSNIEGKVVKLHRYLLNLTDFNIVVDHKNHNPLDNRKCNLRICTSHENALNQRKNKLSSMPIGVQKTKSNKYKARIYVNGKEINLGRYTSIEDAVEARKNAEIKYRGEFAQHLY